MKRTSAAVVLLFPLLGLVAACGGSSGKDASASPAATHSSAASGAACHYVEDGLKPARKVKLPPGNPVTRKPTTATLQTNRGTIRMTLSADETPCTVNSFLSLARQGYFDHTTCHRLTTSGIYVLQCGDPTGTGTGTPGYRFANEMIVNDSRLQPCRKVNTVQGRQQVCTYPAGTVAMANTGKPDSNGSQFFLVYRNSELPPTYTVFGRMNATGLHVVESVAKKGVRGDSGDGTPRQRVEIRKVSP
ncbi:MAG: peptidylprolyl isomerase [Marmoricola sp.]